MVLIFHCELVVRNRACEMKLLPEQLKVETNSKILGGRRRWDGKKEKRKEAQGSSLVAAGDSHSAIAMERRLIKWAEGKERRKGTTH